MAVEVVAPIEMVALSEVLALLECSEEVEVVVSEESLRLPAPAGR